MNVTCPQCTSVFRVDPAKVPERGVRARCSVCGGLIGVRRPAAAPPVIPPVEAVLMAAELPPPPPPPPPPPVEAIAPPPFTVEPPPPPPPAAPVGPVIEPVVAVMPPSVPFTALPTESAPIAPEPVRPPEPAPRPAAGRFANPFLQQDPATRARRLARALVSDLVVYHPEKRQRGLADGTLKELFSEEIRKSWEEYSEQVGEEIATTTPWFTEALNEILAEGRPLFG